MKRLALAACLSLFSLSASATLIPLTALLDGAQEVPQTTQAAVGGSGSASMTFDTLTNVFSWTINYSLNTGPAVAAHFHGRNSSAQPSGAPGTAVPVAFNIPGIPTTSSGTVTGSFDFDTGTLPAGDIPTAQRIADLLAGLWYINIHTQTFPSGEIRGQVTVPEPASLALAALALLGVVAFRRRA